MWFIGTLVVFAIAVAAVVAIGRTPRQTRSQPVWDIASLGGTYTGIVGTLGGFSVTSAIFVAGLDGAQTSPAFAAVIGMLLVAFLILIFSALMYASGPNVPADAGESATRSLSHLLANMCGCLGLAVSWLALVPLLRLLELAGLAQTFTWLLFSVTVAGASWVALFTFRLTKANVLACLALPLLGVLLPGLYRFAAINVCPPLWPAGNPVLHYAFVALGVAGLVFGAHLVLLASYGSDAHGVFLRRNEHVLALAPSAAYAVAAGFTWFAVAG